MSNYIIHKPPSEVSKLIQTQKLNYLYNSKHILHALKVFQHRASNPTQAKSSSAARGHSFKDIFYLHVEGDRVALEDI